MSEIKTESNWPAAVEQLGNALRDFAMAYAAEYRRKHSHKSDEIVDRLPGPDIAREFCLNCITPEPDTFEAIRRRAAACGIGRDKARALLNEGVAQKLIIHYPGIVGRDGVPARWSNAAIVPPVLGTE